MDSERAASDYVPPAIAAVGLSGCECEATARICVDLGWEIVRQMFEVSTPAKLDSLLRATVLPEFLLQYLQEQAKNVLQHVPRACHSAVLAGSLAYMVVQGHKLPVWYFTGLGRRDIDAIIKTKGPDYHWIVERFLGRSKPSKRHPSEELWHREPVGHSSWGVTLEVAMTAAKRLEDAEYQRMAQQNSRRARIGNEGTYRVRNRSTGAFIPAAIL